MEAVLPLVIVFLAQWAQQMPAKEETRSELLRRDYEAGVRYEDAPVATASSPCLADDWSVVLDWGDEEGARPPSRRDAPQVPCGGSGCVPKGGPYRLWTDHVYKKAGKYPVRIEPRIHCFGTHGGAVPYPAGFAAAVYGRIPLARITLSPSSAVPGDSVVLRIQLTAPAPPSGTRVYLVSSPGNFPEIPAFVDVPAMATEQAVRLVVAGAPGSASISARTVPDVTLRRSLKILRKR
jgi:hypothetical protein